MDSLLTVLKDEHWKHVRNNMTPTFTTGKLRRVRLYIIILCLLLIMCMHVYVCVFLYVMCVGMCLGNLAVCEYVTTCTYLFWFGLRQMTSEINRCAAQLASNLGEEAEQGNEVSLKE